MLDAGDKCNTGWHLTMAPENESEKDNPSKLLSNLFRILIGTLSQKAHEIVPVQQKKKIRTIKQEEKYMFQNDPTK